MTTPDFLSAIRASFEALGANQAECRLIAREARDTKVERLVRSLLRNHLEDQGHIAYAEVTNAAVNRGDLQIEIGAATAYIELKQYFDFDCARALGGGKDIWTEFAPDIGKLKKVSESHWRAAILLIIVMMPQSIPNRFLKRIILKYASAYNGGQNYCRQRLIINPSLCAEDAIGDFVVGEYLRWKMDSHKFQAWPDEGRVQLGEWQDMALDLRWFVYALPEFELAD